MVPAPGRIPTACCYCRRCSAPKGGCYGTGIFAPAGPDPGGDELAAVEEHVDGCVEDSPLEPEDATDDVELPASRGGVERPHANS